MRCSKCGEECRDNQAFCIKCGNPIQVVPDFNLIEAELANNIGELLDEEKNNAEDSEEFVEEEVPADVNDMHTRKFEGNLAMDIKMMNLGHREKVVFEDGIENRINEDVVREKVVESVNDDYDYEEYEDSGKDKKRRIIVVSALATIAVVTILALTILLISVFSQKNDYIKATFDSSYAEAEAFISELEYESALEKLGVALEKASNVDEKIKARLLMDKVYGYMTGKEEDKLKNLLELTLICPSEATYFDKVAQIYLANEQYDKLSEFLNSIKNDDVFAAMSAYTVDEPVAKTQTGTYNEYLSIEFTAEEGCNIYYTIHRATSLDDKTNYSAPSVDDELYTKAIKLEEEAIFVIQAVAINELGIVSRTAEYKYSISLGVPSAPVITPTSGAYTEHTLITIEAEAGSKIYYTIDDEEVTEESLLYTEPFEMPLGVHIIRAMVVDKYGIASEVTEESYNLSLTQNYNTVQGKEGVINKLIEDLIIVDNTLVTLDGGKATVNYKETKNINNSTYYIFTISLFDVENVSLGDMYYAFDYNLGTSTKVDIVEGEYILIENTADTEI